MKLTEEQIQKIAENLDSDMCCYCHLKTGEVEITPDFDGDWFGHDTELWQDTLDKLEENEDDYFQFRAMRSVESFKIMAGFTEKVSDQNLQDRLSNALNRPKPFRNFKSEIDNEGEYRERWFDYKNQKAIEFVKYQIEQHNLGLMDEGWGKGGWPVSISFGVCALTAGI